MPEQLNVYVPAGEDFFGIYPGSAVVGFDRASRLCEVYFEGGLYNAGYFADFSNRLLHAAGRCIQHYPTVARLSLPREALQLVGTYEPETQALDVDDRETLDAWVSLWKPRP